MNTIEWLTDPAVRGLYWPGVIAGLAIAILCAVLSVLVVLKRLAFIGQGVSHAAFGGIGVAAVLGLVGQSAAEVSGLAALGQFAVVVLFCLGSALLIAWLSEKGKTEADTVIGIILVGSMAAGAILIQIASRSGRSGNVAWESLLFGSILNVSLADAVVGWCVALVVLGLLWWTRRRMIFWAFDEPVAIASGVRGRAMRTMLMTLLALATVTAMKLAGVVLATALLVLPGATALLLSARLSRVFALALLAGLVGVGAGLVVSFELDWPTGPCIVGVLCGLFALARTAGGFVGRPA
jgi:zinc transport system permease protein